MRAIDEQLGDLLIAGTVGVLVEKRNGGCVCADDPWEAATVRNILKRVA